MCLCAKPGALAALPVVLLGDYLEVKMTLKTKMCCKQVCCRDNVQACLCVNDSVCLATTGSMMRYLVRSQKASDLYRDENVDAIEQVL